MKQLEYPLEKIDQAAKTIVREIKPGDIVAFEGDLASGKTTLIQAILRNLKYAGRVNSPTFVIEHRYKIDHGKIKEVAHLDLYRLKEDELDNFDFEEYGQSNQLTFIEWPGIARDQLPASIKTLSLEIVNDNIRKITFSDNFSD